MAAQKFTTLDEFLASLDADKLAQVSALRDIIKGAGDLTEHIKWNAPSYVLNGENRMTFNLLNKEGVIKLVLHMGALRKEDRKASPVLKEDEGIVEWVSDIRGMITFKDLEDVQAKSAALTNVLKRWLAIG